MGSSTREDGADPARGTVGSCDPAADSQQLLQAVLEDQTDFILRWTPERTVTWANDACCRWLDRPREDIVGDRRMDALPPPVREALLDALGRLTVETPSWTVTAPGPEVGAPRWIEWVTRGVFDDGGVLSTLQSVGRDITQRRAEEESLRESEAWFRVLIDNAPEAITLLDGETGAFLSFNDRTADLLGRSREELAGAVPSGLSPTLQPDGRPSAESSREHLDRALRGEAPVFEWMHTRGDGSEVPCEIRLTRLPVPGRQLIRASMIDLTDWKAAEEALRESRERLQVFTGAGFEGIGVTEDGTILDLNAQLAEMLGWERGELVGRPLLDIVAKESREEFRRRVAEDSEDPWEHMAVRKDGSVFPVEVRRRAMTYQNREVRVTAMRDLTRRKKMEAALRQSEADFRGLVEHAPYGITRVSIDGEVLSANSALAQMLGHSSPDTVLGMDLPESICRDLKAGRGLIRAMRENRPIQGMELEWVRTDDQDITVWISGRPVPGEDGVAECFELIAEDVTERRKLQAQLRQAQKMEAVGQLTGGIAHDFNNLLSVILLHAELLGDALEESNPVLRSAVQGVREAAERAADMTTQLLGFSRQANLAFVPTDLADVARSLSSMVRRLLPETIEVEIMAEPEIKPVNADSGAVEQMLLNLATNARDAMPEGGRLQITVAERLADEHFCATRPWAKPGRYVCVTVSDTGLGMDEETRRRIFEPFFTTKPAGMGTGLGMAMVYGLTKQHEGFVDVESEVGEGTSISLCFPVLTTPHFTASAGVEAEFPGGSETVLLVEDEEMLRHVGKGVLRQHGYSVLVAGDGEEALELYGEHAEDIDLIVSDVVMPHLGGFELLEAFRQDQDGPRILLTSGYPGRDGEKTRRVEPDVPFLEKPWKAGDLLKTVREILDAP